MIITQQQAIEAIQDYRRAIAAYHDEPTQANHAAMMTAERVLRQYIKQGAGADVQIVPAGTLVHMQGLPFNLKSDALMEGANFHLLEKQTPSVEGAATVQSTYEAVERQSGETGELYQTATSDDALQALIYASKVYRAHGIPTDGIEATITRLQGQQPEPEYNPLLIDGVEHDPLCLKVYRSPLKECDCGAQAAQAPVQPQAVVPAPAIQLAKSRVGRVYLAGPMTGYENFNFPAFNAAAQRLRTEGFDVVNPADHGIVDGAEWADYLRFDLEKLAQCESIALLPGWEASKGANLEVSVAQKLGMVVRCLDGAAQPSTQAERAPVVQAVPAGEYPPLPEPAYPAIYAGLGRFSQRAGYTAAQLRAYVDADRASRGATPADVRMLTREELNDVAMSEQVGWGPGEYIEAIQRKFCAINAGKRIPADGVIGGV